MDPPPAEVSSPPAPSTRHASRDFIATRRAVPIFHGSRKMHKARRRGGGRKRRGFVNASAEYLFPSPVCDLECMKKCTRYPARAHARVCMRVYVRARACVQLHAHLCARHFRVVPMHECKSRHVAAALRMHLLCTLRVLIVVHSFDTLWFHVIKWYHAG